MEKGLTRYFLAYVEAAAAVAVALGVRWLADPVLHGQRPWVTLFAAVAYCIWRLGLWPAVFSAVLGFGWSEFLYVAQLEGTGRTPMPTPLAAILFGSTCGVIIAIGQALRLALARERRHAEDLEQTKKELEAANQQKELFLAALSHELRNPLAPIYNAVHLAETGSPEIRQKALEMIGRNAGHIRRLVEDLLDVTRISRGVLSLNLAPLDLCGAVEDGIQMAHVGMAEARQKLQVSLPETAVIVDGDHVRLAEVFANLLINAHKFTPDNGEIRVSVESVDGFAKVEVADRGAGLAPETLRSIFDLFSQVGDAEKGRSLGLGVGLSLAKQIVDLHHGTIEASSDGLGKGSRFVVRLPVRKEAPMTPVA